MTTTIVHLVRHGEVYNPERILYGRLPDYHLSARGTSQAARTAAIFQAHDVVYLAASPLQRAQETAAPFASITGQEIRTDEDLLEAGNKFEGLRTKGWRSQLWNPKYWPLLLNPIEPSWGESYADIFSRMWSAVERARNAAEGHEAILVSHQLPIVTVQRHAAGKPLAHMSRQCNLASVTSLVFAGNTLVDHHYSEPAREI
ncbi:histidine phosphatase family protein [Corynebacterium caspium]|uniref:histidine phosphatase family protein n=1 Tax=Corynebacterium caspium TaxID=234828 RepID=UPI00036FCBA5|nr:histidine phosphatase family protein [Corynebacterium caspium]WKD59896.1 bifunctional RNase H/acid phosphatase [Corynebacterium caspium DSM 44850]